MSVWEFYFSHQNINMTIEEFQTTRFGAGMTAVYKTKIYDITSVDFEESLIELRPTESDRDEDEFWVRCENIKLLES